MSPKRGKRMTQLAKGKRSKPHKLSNSPFNSDIKNCNNLYYINQIEPRRENYGR